MTLQRWGGRLTSRPLPDDDSIALLDETARSLLGRSWLMRSSAERRAADIFELIAKSLRAVNEQPALIELADRAIDDEMRHAELCRVVASKYAGRELSADRFALDAPKHEGASEDLRYSLWIVGQCAFNETTASAFLEASFEQATAPLAHAALRELLSDEIDHARIGWAHLASVSHARKQQIAQWIPRMLDANRREWGKAAGADDDRFAAHGWISKASIAKAIEEAEQEVIRPGLERVGIAHPSP
jgi:hypothetical protein